VAVRALAGEALLAPLGGNPFPGALFRALLLTALAAAAVRLDEGAKIVLAVVIGDFVARMDGPDRRNEDLVLTDVGLGVRLAGVVDIARDIAAAGAVNRPAGVDLEQILGLSGPK
jgi:hypothetical protein